MEKNRKDRSMKAIAIIPARYNLPRFPGKPLADILGKPMIWWVYQNCKSVPEFKEVVVATDDSRIFHCCEELGMDVFMTSTHHETGTDWVCEVATKKQADLYVSVQGDAPLLEPRTIAHILDPFKSGNNFQVYSLMARIKNPCELINPAVPKAITNKDNNAVFLTRAVVPFSPNTVDVVYYKQVCVCAFTPSALGYYSEYTESFGRAKVEAIEDIDLLRFIEGGIPVHFIEVTTETVAVETPKDLESVIEMIRGSSRLMKNVVLLKMHNE